MRFGIISDIHYGPVHESTNHPGHFRMDSERVIEVLPRTIDRFNQLELDAVLEMGDLINPVDHDVDLRHITALLQIFSNCRHPVYYLLGNHDLDNLTFEEVSQEFINKGQNLNYYISQKFDQWQLHCFNFNKVKSQDFIREESLDRWQKSIDPALNQCLTCHYPLTLLNLDQTFYFDKHQDKAYLGLNPFESYLNALKTPTLTLNGHLHHLNYLNQKHVHTLTFPGYSENMQSRILGSAHPETYGILDICDKMIEFTSFSGDFVLARLQIPLLTE